MDDNMVQIGNWRYFRLDRPGSARKALIALLDSLEMVQSTRGPMHDLKWIIKPCTKIGDQRGIIGWKAQVETKETK